MTVDKGLRGRVGVEGRVSVTRDRGEERDSEGTTRGGKGCSESRAIETQTVWDPEVTRGTELR